MRFPVFDLHCDTALAMLGDKMEQSKSLENNDCHIDLTRASELAGYAQCFACFTTSWESLPGGLTPEKIFRRELAVVERQVKASRRMVFAGSAEEIRANREKGMMSAILTIEGPAGFGFDPGRLPELYDRGFRVTTLTWNEKNPLAGSHATGGGLTELGREYVKTAQDLGMLIDVSHLSDEAFWDLMDMTRGPVIASHSNSRAVCNVSRNLTDEMFRAICRTGGVTGINLYAHFLGKGRVTMDTVTDHIIHFLELDPNGSHIALGGDLDGCDKLPEGFAGIQDYNALAEHLLSRGLKEKTIRDIYWNNAIGVMENAVRNHKIGC